MAVALVGAVGGYRDSAAVNRGFIGAHQPRRDVYSAPDIKEMSGNRARHPLGR